MNFCLVIPFFNEEKNIEKVISQLKTSSIPVVFVDDGSTDKTVSIIEKSAIKNYKIVAHKLNLGKGEAMKTGVTVASQIGYDAVIFIDGDGQHKLKDLDKFIDKLLGDCDVVFGIRRLNKNMPLVRLIGNKMMSLLVSLIYKENIPDILCGYRGIKVKSFEKLKLESSGYGIETEMVAKSIKNKLKYCQVPVATIYHDNMKGVTILNAIEIIGTVIYWKLKQ